MGARARIVVVLPVREVLSQRKSGAVALSLRDFTAFSRFAAETVIVGAFPCDLDRVPFHQLVGWRRWHLRDRVAYARAAAAFAKQAGAALIEVQNRPTILTMMRKLLPDAKLALFLHNDPQEMEGTGSPAARRRILAAADAVYCVSAFVRGRFLEGLSAGADKVGVVPNGLDMTKIPRRPKEKIVAFAGRIVAEKGVVELIRAFALAAPQMPEWRLVIAGEDKRGLLGAGGLRREIAALGERALLLGSIGHAETLTLFARAEIAAAPALWREPFGRTTLEAMAAGCAVVSSGSGGSGEVLGDCGLIVDPVTPGALADALILLAGDEARRRDLQARAAARAAAFFDIRASAARLDDLRTALLVDAAQP
jgi:UDP-glucose:(glucosyl)LPS alpha-1,2-glucosyltransferase